MKNKKKWIFGGLIGLAILIILGVVGYKLFFSKERLTVLEEQWITTNSAKVQSISVINDQNIFGDSGSGVFYQFLQDFSDEYHLDVNPVTYKADETVSGTYLGVSNTLNENMQVFYEDHYVIVSKDKTIFTSIQDLQNKEVGVLSKNASYVSDYFSDVNGISLKQYNSEEELLKDFDEKKINYLLVPLFPYLDVILKSDYTISYHFSDMKSYYVISGAEDSNNRLASILKKYYRSWKEEYLESYVLKSEFTLFTKSLGISEAEVEAIRSINYNYGFVNNSPYEILTGGNYGGILAAYLKSFSDFSDVDFKFNKFKNYKKFTSAINKGEINVFFNYYTVNNDFIDVNSGLGVSFDVITNVSNDLVIHSLNSLKNQTVYVEKDSFLASYLKNLGYLKVETYEDIKQAKKLIKKDAILVMDSNSYVYYSKNDLKDALSRYHYDTTSIYQFELKTNEAFKKLFSKYLNTLDSETMIMQGLYNHEITLKHGSFRGTLAKYILYLVVILVIVFVLLYRSSRKIKVARRIKKEDKIKFIDQLTSLKNRNYLSENIEAWNKNTIYPQTVIVIDLNNLQFINDTYGYQEGDKQIKAAANILIKTQLDNTDIIRTDGNEFVIYLVGYQSKQITSFIHKLNKEFKKLPYDFGVAIGYSMINDDLKSIEDATNEAVEDVKKQKELKKEEKQV